MKNRRTFLLSLTSGFVALAVLAGSVVADELIGFISKVDVEGQKLTVTTKGGEDKEVSVDDATEVVTKKGTSKLNLARFAKNVERAKEKNGKGVRATLTHDGGKVSKIEFGKRKAE